MDVRKWPPSTVRSAPSVLSVFWLPSCRMLVAAVLTLSLIVGPSPSAGAQSCPTPEPVPLSALLLPPPCDRCGETKAELHELQALERSRTPQVAKHAEDDHVRSVSRFLGEIGVKVREEQLGAADHFFKCVTETVDDAVNRAKQRFDRTRPYKLPNNGLHILKDVETGDTTSYPSGHAAYGAAVGLVLAEMIPELRDKIFARIEDYGLSRMRAGVHFRSDVYAGELAGAAIVASLEGNAEFQRAFNEAKIDLRKAVGY